MSQVEIYGFRMQLQPIRGRLSDTIHAWVVDAVLFPVDKRAIGFSMWRPRISSEQSRQRRKGDEHTLNYKIDV